jgi:hypothetical protein
VGSPEDEAMQAMHAAADLCLKNGAMLRFVSAGWHSGLLGSTFSTLCAFDSRANPFFSSRKPTLRGHLE